MGKADYKPFDIAAYPIKDVSSLHIGIIRTEWNDDIVSKLVSSSKEELGRLGISGSNIYEYSVPGSYELPMGAKMMLGSQIKADAVICLGCVIQGQTKHDDYINHTVARSINQLSLVSGTPVIFGVLTVNSLDQALDRAGGSRGDKGIESAIAALKMISLKEQLANQKRRISF